MLKNIDVLEYIDLKLNNLKNEELKNILMLNSRLDSFFKQFSQIESVLSKIDKIEEDYKSFKEITETKIQNQINQSDYKMTSVNKIYENLLNY